MIAEDLIHDYPKATAKERNKAAVLLATKIVKIWVFDDKSILVTTKMPEAPREWDAYRNMNEVIDTL